jgi:hypothetical protein
VAGVGNPGICSWQVCVACIIWLLETRTRIPCWVVCLFVCLFACARTIDLEEMAGTGSVGVGYLDELFGTTDFIQVGTIKVTLLYVIICPSLSGDEFFPSVATSHGIGAGCFLLVARFAVATTSL